MTTPQFVCPFAVNRLVLPPMEITDVIPPMTCASVTISNRTTDDLKVYTTPDHTVYFIITSEFEERLDMPQAGPDVRVFRAGMINFALEAIAGGEVVLLWT